MSSYYYYKYVIFSCHDDCLSAAAAPKKSAFDGCIHYRSSQGRTDINNPTIKYQHYSLPAALENVL